MDKKMKSVHITLRITVNEGSGWYLSAPRVDKDMNFSLPVEMFDAKKFASMVEKAIADAEAELPEASVEYERKEAETKKEKAEKEAEVSAQIFLPEFPATLFPFGISFYKLPPGFSGGKRPLGMLSIQIAP